MQSNKPSTELIKTELTRHDEIAPDVFVIGFKRTHDFMPGQAIKLSIDAENPPRIYSICNGTDDKELCVLFNIKHDGFLTPKLATLQVGDIVYASAPYGSFLGTAAPAYWIATGTGIAPFRSMIRSGMAQDKILVHGVRQQNQFYFSDELQDVLGENYHRCCSTGGTDKIISGRVNVFLNNQKTLPTNCRYYICGQATMAVEIRDLLIGKGIPFANIFTEIYF